MELLFSAAFVKYEIAFLGLNVAYIVFHVLHSLVVSYLKIRNFVKPKRGVEMGEKKENTEADAPEIPVKKLSEKEKIKQEKMALSNEEKQHLAEIIKNVKTRIARGEFWEARSRIVEGLSIEKFNKELNCLLASLYEKEHDYKKAELIYKDLILLNDTDPELYLKLGFALSIQGKYEIAYEIYKRLHFLEKENFETIEMLANIGHQLSHHDESNEYARLFLKKHPHSVDMLYLTAVNYINLEDRKKALEYLKKIRTIDPYNGKIQELIKKVELEAEMENNFKTEK
ncbi:MAG: hypothetical protein ACD_78C00422G0010 [uncultured bacterium (gcode 4)]|uniref:Uncharacterized protein n=1 Tax=uncultured bacterium (gcode 4) TaxID=1234023 RepID=K1XVX3_9BACT|nr:MAG: hypothetical protein ACD_78C00422G0010 [uncultured bacterium (gcode 4)]